MSISIDDIFVEFECEHCHNKEMVSVGEIIISGHPICDECSHGEQMEYDNRVHIPEYGD